MRSFADYKLFQEDSTLFPDHTPMYMPAELTTALPKHVSELHRAFKNPSLKRVQKDIQGAETPAVQSLRGHDVEARAKLVANDVLKVQGNKLYIIGNFARNLAIEKLHTIVHQNDDFDLATDASPVATKIIIETAVKDRILPHSTKIEDVEGDKFANLKIIFSDDGIAYKIATFPFTRYKGAPRMFLDYLHRHFTTNFYYDIEKEELIDLGHGLAAIAKKEIHPIGGDLEAKLKDNPVNAITYMAQFASINEAGPETRNIKPEYAAALRKTKLPHEQRKNINNEFKKGIKVALDKKNYINLLHHFGLLEQIFPVHDLNIAIKDSKIKIPSVTVAQLLANHWHSEPELRHALTYLGFETSESNDVVLLVKLPHYGANTPGFTAEDFHKDRIKSNLSEPVIKAYADMTQAHNRQWLTQQLGKSSYTDKHLGVQNTPTLQAAHFDINALWTKARKFYEQSQDFTY